MAYFQEPHSHTVGATGSGKSTHTKRKIIDAIRAGFAVCYIDVHGHDTDDLLQYIPIKRRKDVVIFDPSQFATPWNPLQTGNIPLAGNTFLTSIKAAWDYDTMPTPRLDSVLYNALAALMDARQGLFGLYLLLTSASYRKHIVWRLLSDNHHGRLRQPSWPVGLNGRRACPSGGQSHRPHSFSG